jgi:hypothetical protein
MSSATLISPPISAARLVVDTVASFIFKWHPQFAPRYVEMVTNNPKDYRHLDTRRIVTVSTA